MAGMRSRWTKALGWAVLLGFCLWSYCDKEQEKGALIERIEHLESRVKYLDDAHTTLHAVVGDLLVARARGANAGR